MSHKDENDFFGECLRSALILARFYNLKLFPVAPPVFDGRAGDGKIPAEAGWQEKATNDEREVQRWFLRYAQPSSRGYPGRVMNLGVACGPSEIVVVDVDPRDGGDLLQLPMSFGERNTLTACTGGGGTQLYYRRPAGLVVKSSAGKLVGHPGIDIRAEGGLVVAPPSLHKSGNRYEWESDAGPGECKMMVLPSCMVELLRESESIDRPGEGRGGGKKLPESIPEGKRHSVLLSAAGSMRWKGFCTEAIHAALLVENQMRCNPPLSEKEIEILAKSMERYPAGNKQRNIEKEINEKISRFRQEVWNEPQ